MEDLPPGFKAEGTEVGQSLFLLFLQSFEFKVINIPNGHVLWQPVLGPYVTLLLTDEEATQPHTSHTSHPSLFVSVLKNSCAGNSHQQSWKEMV